MADIKTVTNCKNVESCIMCLRQMIASGDSDFHACIYRAVRSKSFRYKNEIFENRDFKKRDWSHANFGEIQRNSKISLSYA